LNRGPESHAAQKELLRFVIEPARHGQDDAALAAEIREMMKEEIALLDLAASNALAANLVAAVRWARMPWPVKRSDVSGLEWKQEVLAFDVGAAMRQAGLPIRSWRHDANGRDPGRDEALFYRLLRACARMAGFAIPADALWLKRRAEQITLIKLV
jgi:hypothetical protein